ncbi:hypothetical protein RGUI_3328 [Rhodovulum sp. P5]|nr:hypothetical protein RGUI_3328 [Rhodovulum sp. P5]
MSARRSESSRNGSSGRKLNTGDTQYPPITTPTAGTLCAAGSRKRFGPCPKSLEFPPNALYSPTPNRRWRPE